MEHSHKTYCSRFSSLSQFFEIGAWRVLQKNSSCVNNLRMRFGLFFRLDSAPIEETTPLEHAMMFLENIKDTVDPTLHSQLDVVIGQTREQVRTYSVSWAVKFVINLILGLLLRQFLFRNLVCFASRFQTHKPCIILQRLGVKKKCINVLCDLQKRKKWLS